MPLLGTGFAPALFALTLLALPPILHQYATPRSAGRADIVDAARGMGMTAAEIVRKIELPIAMPVIFAGMRTAAMQVISGAVLAAYIGGGGLGDFITAGIAMMAVPQLLVGAIPATLLALAADSLFGRMQRALTPRGLRERMIEIVGLTQAFAGAARPAVDRLTLDVADGEVCVLIGPSGCGKTTTMRMINRMIEPDSGRSRSAVATSRRSTRSSCAGASATSSSKWTVSALVDRREHRHGAAASRLGRRRRSARASTSCWRWSAWTPRSIAIAFRASCRADSGSASALPARWRPIRR